MSKVPHKHAGLIKMWADGADIQLLTSSGWFDAPFPRWWEDHEYRLKPEPKPDVVLYGVVDSVDSRCIPSLHFVGPVNGNPNNNIKLIFDGETGKLKSVEVINDTN